MLAFIGKLYGSQKIFTTYAMTAKIYLQYTFFVLYLVQFYSEFSLVNLKIVN